MPSIALAIKALIAAALGGARLHVWLGATGEDGYHAGVALAAWAAPGTERIAQRKWATLILDEPPAGRAQVDAVLDRWCEGRDFAR